MDENDFISIRISSLRGDIKIPFDVYVKIAGKYIHYCRTGESFEGKRLNRLKEKKLQKLYILRLAEKDFTDYLRTSLNTAFDPNSKKDIAIRTEVVHGFAQSASEDIFENPVNPNYYSNLIESSKRFATFLSRDNAALKAIYDIENIDNNIGHHGTNVAATAFYLARHLKYTNADQLTNLIAGCLIHDIDHAHTGFNVAGLRSNFSEQELSVYKKHPRNGLLRFENLSMNPLIKNIIHQHEEACDGSGFPSGLKEKDLDPLVVIAAVSNAFDRVVTFEGKRPKEALKFLLIDKMGVYPLAYLHGLQEVLRWSGVLIS